MWLTIAPAFAAVPVEPAADQLALLGHADPQLAANKKLVFDFARVVLQARQVDRVGEYLAESYVEHDPNVATGRAAFVESLGQSAPESVKSTVDDLVSIVAERDVVVVALRREHPDLENEGQTYTTTWLDMYRIANGLIVEHWAHGTKE
jgi:predicted SnoaL-like aldol condensation-catalyzing enzyme